MSTLQICNILSYQLFLALGKFDVTLFVKSWAVELRVDCFFVVHETGKLQTLDNLLRYLKSGKHRVLIFTQMTRMLDVLEAFLNYHGYIYLRLDGTTRVDQRQVIPRFASLRPKVHRRSELLLDCRSTTFASMPHKR